MRRVEPPKTAVFRALFIDPPASVRYTHGCCFPARTGPTNPSFNGGNVTFQTGDKVIYPNHGLGIVERIEEKTILGTTCGFFHLRIVSNDTTVLVPDRKSTRLNSSHSQISYAVFCLKKKKQN